MFDHLIAKLILLLCPFMPQYVATIPATHASGGGGSVATYDSTAGVQQGHANNSTTVTISITVSSGNSDLALHTCGLWNDTGSAAISSVTDGGDTFAADGTKQTGSSADYYGQCWSGAVATSGSKTVTITWSAAPSGAQQFLAYSTYNTNQTSPGKNLISTVSGSLAASTSANDLAIFTEFDAAAERTISGCTSTLDVSAGGPSFYYNSAHCTASGSTTTATWSSIGSNSIGMAIDVPHS